MNKIRFNYGQGESQFFELSLPKGTPQAVICLFHGGFWRMPYDLRQMDDIVALLCEHNFAVCNIEYRRTGAGGGIYESSKDALNAIKMLESDELSKYGLPLEKIIIIGHSAGGQLALFCGNPNLAFDQITIPKPNAIIGLAAISDLALMNNFEMGKKSICDFVGDFDKNIVDKFSPYELFPYETKIILLHGEADNYVPLTQTLEFEKKATALGCKFKSLIIKDEGHMEFLNPNSVSAEMMIKEILNLCLN